MLFRSHEQIELSQCVIGANPNALAKAYKAGALSDEDLDNLSRQIANAKSVSPAASPADAEATQQRARLAFLAGIQIHL